MNGAVPVNGQNGLNDPPDHTFAIASASKPADDPSRKHFGTNLIYGVNGDDYVDFVVTFVSVDTWVSGYRQYGFSNDGKTSQFSKDIQIFVGDSSTGPWEMVTEDRHAQWHNDHAGEFGYTGTTTEWTPTRPSKCLLIRTLSNWGETAFGGQLLVRFLQIKARVKPEDVGVFTVWRSDTLSFLGTRVADSVSTERRTVVGVAAEHSRSRYWSVQSFAPAVPLRLDAIRVYRAVPTTTSTRRLDVQDDEEDVRVDDVDEGDDHDHHNHHDHHEADEGTEESSGATQADEAEEALAATAATGANNPNGWWNWLEAVDGRYYTVRVPQRVVGHSAAASLVTAATLELAGVGEGAEDAQDVLNVTNASNVPNAHKGQHVVMDRACQLLNCSVGLPVHVYDMDLPTKTIPCATETTSRPPRGCSPP